MKILTTVGSLILIAGLALGQFHLIGSTPAMIILIAGAALMVAGAIRKHTRPGDFNRSGWSGS